MDNRYIISFDIGIHNLAMCIFSFISDEKKYKLHEWTVLDINKQQCPFINKKGGICTSNCTYNSGGSYYCTKHKPVSAKKNKDTYFDFNKNLYLLLNTVVASIDVGKIDAILIEQQPLKNPKMKNISYLVHGFFMKCFIDCGRILTENEPVIEFISPKNKLEKKYQGFLEGLGCNMSEILKKVEGIKDKYKIRKMTAVLITDELISIENNKRGEKIEISDEIRERFSEKKKQDDLSDCLLQGIWYLFSNKKI